MQFTFRLGLDAKILADIVNSSSGKCWSSELYNPVPGILSNAPSSKNYEVTEWKAFCDPILSLYKFAETES